MRFISGVGLVLLAVAGVAQTRPEFEVASVKPSAPAQMGQRSVGVHIDGAQLRCSTLSMKDYVGCAYRLRGYQISGPDWLGSRELAFPATVPARPPRRPGPGVMPLPRDEPIETAGARE